MKKIIMIFASFMAIQSVQCQLLNPEWLVGKAKSEGVWSYFHKNISPIFICKDFVYFSESGDLTGQIVKYDFKTQTFEEKKIAYPYKNNEITNRAVINTKNGSFFIFADEFDGKAIIAKSDLINSPDNLIPIYEEKTIYKNPFGLPSGGSRVMNTHEYLEDDFNTIIGSSDSTKFVYVYGQGALDVTDNNAVNLVYFDDKLNYTKSIQYQSDLPDRQINLVNAVVINNNDVYLVLKIDCNSKVKKGVGWWFEYFKSDKEVDFDDFVQLVCIKADGTIKRVDFTKSRYLYDSEIIKFDDGIGIFTIFTKTFDNKVPVSAEYFNGYMYVKSGEVQTDVVPNLPKINWLTSMSFRRIFLDKSNQTALCFNERNGCSQSMSMSGKGGAIICSSSEVTIYKITKLGDVSKTVIDKEFEDITYNKFIGSSFYLYNNYYYVLYNDKKHAKEIAKLGVKGEIKTCLTKLDMNGNIVATYYINNLEDALSISTKSSIYMGDGKVLLMGMGRKDYQVGILNLP